LSVIVTCFAEKDGVVLGLQKESPSKKWTCRNINRLQAKDHHTGTTDCKKGSGRPVTMMTCRCRHSHKTRSQVPYRCFSLLQTVKKIIFTEEKDFILKSSQTARMTVFTQMAKNSNPTFVEQNLTPQKSVFDEVDG